MYAHPTLLTLLLSGHLGFLGWLFAAIVVMGPLLVGGTLAVAGGKVIAKMPHNAVFLAALLLLAMGIVIIVLLLIFIEISILIIAQQN
ncbi:MAG: hypothetical protein ACRYFX_02560 [Janthinobacterium lividum]